MIKNNNCYTSSFLKAADIAVKFCQSQNIKIAILKEGSPSCGSHTIYTGQFNNTKIKGMGVVATALTNIGVKCFSENNIVEAQKYLLLLRT